MTNSHKQLSRVFTLVAVAAWVAHLVLIWFYRFVPSVDYPNWLLQTNILSHYNDPSYNFKEWYEIIPATVPNGGFVLPAAMLAKFLEIELAGKIILSCYIIGFPLSVRYFFRSVGNSYPLWLLSIALLFNVSFLYGNISFLISVCLLLLIMGFSERTNEKINLVTSVIMIFGTLTLFVAHAIGAFVFLCYLVVQMLFEKYSRKRKILLGACTLLMISLSIIYCLMPSPEIKITGLEYGPDIIYRFHCLIKSFITGWAFPPYDFSFLRTTATMVLMMTVVVISVTALLQIIRRRPLSSMMKFTLILTLLTPFAPQSFAGGADIVQRLALISCLLLMAFFDLRLQFQMMFMTLAVFSIGLVTIVRIQDYKQSSRLLSARFEFLSNTLQRVQGVLTLDDDLGQKSTPSFYLLPKEFHFIFQSDYNILKGGYDPLTFRTGYVRPRDNFIFTLENLHIQRASGSLLLLRGGMVPTSVSHVVFDGSLEWVKQMTGNMQSSFKEVARREIVPGIYTIVLQRN